MKFMRSLEDSELFGNVTPTARVWLNRSLSRIEGDAFCSLAVADRASCAGDVPTRTPLKCRQQFQKAGGPT